MTKHIKPTQERKRSGFVSKRELYSMLTQHAFAAITRIGSLVNSNNENVALGASKAIIERCVPLLKAVEWKGDAVDQRTLIMLGWGDKVNIDANNPDKPNTIQGSSKVSTKADRSVDSTTK